MPDSSTREQILIKAEQATIGSMLIDESRKYLILGLELLEASDFYRPAHQELFTSLKNIEPTDARLDEITLQEELRKRGKLDMVGGTEYIMACVASVPAASNLKHYAKIVKENSLLRQQEAIGLKLSAKLKREDSDPAEIQSWLTGEIDNLSGTNGTGPQHIRKSIMAVHERMENAHKIKGLAGFSSGMSRIDIATGGITNQFVVLKAKRGTGKTHTAIQWIINCLKFGKAVVFYSIDTNGELVTRRMLAHLSGINSHRLKKPRPEDWDSIIEHETWLYEKPLFMHCQANVSAVDITMQCKAIQNKGNDIGLVVIDYMEKVKPVKTSGNKEVDLSESARIISNIPEKLDTAVLLLSQVNDQGRERWSSSIGDQCDLLLAWSDATEVPNLGIMTIEKAREYEGKVFQCNYDYSTSRLWDTEPDYSEPDYQPVKPWWL